MNECIALITDCIHVPQRRLTRLSANHVDPAGLKGAATAGDPVEQARQAWTAASASGATLFAEHVAAMDELHAPGLEVEGNLELARLVNSSMHALLGSYRNDSHYSSAPEGLVSTRYSGHVSQSAPAQASHLLACACAGNAVI